MRTKIAANRTGRFLRCRKGSVAIEFAIVAPFLILLIGAITEVGAFLLIQYQLQLATERAARLLETNRITTASEFKTKVCSNINLGPNCINDIHVDVRTATKFRLLQPREIVNVDSEHFDAIQRGTATSVIVTRDWTFLFPFIGDFSRLFPGGGHMGSWGTGVGFANVSGRADIRRLHGISVFMTEQ